ncbi:MAG: ferredoxin--NADP reductase [Burkholderiales bacterium]|jgi:ferredoxin--NADP+ reductase|nr:ferredoxin--NADP reductase [Betaproteobacteria bacterium]
MPDDTVNDPPKVVSAPIVYRHEWNSHLLSIRIARDPGYRFTPGQFARIGLADGNGETTWRAYSIVSAPHEPFLEFFLVVLPGGKFSARVAKLAIGEEILLEKPAQGFLTLDRFRDGADLWLIGTGTGLAPYVSMLREPSTWKRFQNIVIALSVREAQDLAYVDEIETLAASHTAGEAKLHFVKSLTRDRNATPAANILHGRLTTLTESGELEANAELAFDLDRSRFMLCGNPEMVEAMRAILKARGFAMNRRLTPGHIIVENYW